MQLSCSPAETTTAVRRTDVRADLYCFALGNVQALVKAGEIWTRGTRMMNTACVGSVMMGVDDSVAEMQARLSCGGLPQLIDLEADIAPRAISRAFSRVCMLTRMAGQLVGDALVPLERRVGAAFDTLGKLAT